MTKKKRASTHAKQKYLALTDHEGDAKEGNNDTLQECLTSCDRFVCNH